MTAWTFRNQHALQRDTSAICMHSSVTGQLASAAYNVGEMVVRRAVLRANSKDFALLSNRRMIPAETRAYVPAVTAAAHLLTNNSLPGCSAAEMLRMDDCPLTVQ